MCQSTINIDYSSHRYVQTHISFQMKKNFESSNIGKCDEISLCYFHFPEEQKVFVFRAKSLSSSYNNILILMLIFRLLSVVRLGRYVEEGRLLSYGWLFYIYYIQTSVSHYKISFSLSQMLKINFKSIHWIRKYKLMVYIVSNVLELNLTHPNAECRSRIRSIKNNLINLLFFQVPMSHTIWISNSRKLI